MPLNPDFGCDTEFLKLLTRRSDIDLTAAALELAREADPTVDFSRVYDWIEARARELAGPGALARTEKDALRELSRCLAEEHGLCGDSSAYLTAESSFLHRVIETRCGLPISLSVLYIAVGQAVGLDLRGVAAPVHFLVRYESVEGPLFVDPFHCGRILAPLECKAWLSSISAIPQGHMDAMLEPVEPRKIIIRMLNNLKALYASQENWTAAWNVQSRLTALLPSAYEERRDLALFSIKAQRPGYAIDLLKSCIRTAPCDERSALQENLKLATRAVSRMN